MAPFSTHAKKSCGLYESSAGPQRSAEVSEGEYHTGCLASAQITILRLSPSEFYEPGALMMEEEGVVMGGLLVGLNVIDANLCIKGEDLDSQVSPGGIGWPTHRSELGVNRCSSHL